VKRAALVVLLGVSPSLSACDLPKVVFDLDATASTSENSSTGGGGTSGGGGGTGPQHTTGSGASGAGGSAGSSTSSSGGFMGPVVPCGKPSVECDPYQICCYHVFDTSMDHCDNSDTCDLQFYGALKCNGPEDCPGGVCCLKTTVSAPYTYKDSECKASCPVDQSEMCHDAMTDCAMGQSCMVMLANYEGYNFCE
jgi:hypothetical protein